MRNKSLWLKLGLMAVTVGGVALSFTSAASIFNLNFDTKNITADSTKSIINKMMYVHFADNGNNFGGFLYFSNGFEGNDEEIPGDQNELTKVSANGTTYGCSKQIKGFYYNAERGERLWPLDAETWSDVFGGKGLTTSGGIYLNCVTEGYYTALEDCRDDDNFDKYTDCVNKAKKIYAATGFGYYGSIVQNYSGQNFNLTMGVDYNENVGGDKFISIKEDSKLVPSFVNLDNQAPVGFVYDYNGGVGLAGCRFSGSDSNTLDNNLMKKLIGEYHTKGLSNMFKYNMSERTITYNSEDDSKFASGDIICKPISVADTLLKILIEGIVGMNEGGDDGNTKMGSVGNTTDVKMQYFGTKSVDTSTLMNYAIKKAELLCRGKWEDDPNTNDTILCYKKAPNSALNLNSLDRKTMVVKQGNVKVSPFTRNDQSKRYDLYLLEGNLIIDEDGAEAKRFVFTTGGFISEVNVLDFSGQVNNANGSYDGSAGAAVGVFLRGNFIVNGEVQGDSDDRKLKNKYFIYGEFTTKDTLKKLESTFSWTCKNGMGSDGNYCPEYSSQGSPYQNKSLIVIDQNYGSPLLR